MIKPWEEIINTSIIGTDKKQINNQGLPDDLVRILERLEESIPEKEECFLKSASVIYNYRRGGFSIPEHTIDPVEICAPESKTYTTPSAAASLKAALGDDTISLVYYWLLQCNKHNRIALPEFVPTLLSIAEKQKDLRFLITKCLGERGIWMMKFNTAWNFSESISYREVFDHGKSEERKAALIEWRNHSPAEAREALIASWKEEQAATKAELLSALETNLSKEDEVFLTEAWKEKSQKVKDVALKLLKQIPDSFIVNEIWHFVQALVSYKKGSALLGLVNKDRIDINLSFEMPEHFKTYGISHLDANKLYTEKEFTINQLIGIIPPSMWETHFDLDPKQILELFHKKEETQKYISSFGWGANTFKNKEWAIILYRSYNKLCSSVIKEFDRELQEEIALTSLQDYRNIYDLLPGKETEWTLSFTIALLEKTAQEPYSYPKNFYKHLIHHFPVAVIEKLDAIVITDPLKKSYWDTISEDLKKMLSIKQHIIQSF